MKIGNYGHTMSFKRTCSRLINRYFILLIDAKKTTQRVIEILSFQKAGSVLCIDMSDLNGCPRIAMSQVNYAFYI